MEHDDIPQRIVKRVTRLEGHLTDLLRESFPEKAENYEVVSHRVSEYVNGIVSQDPVEVSLVDDPTYEFYLKPSTSEGPLVRVMILHRPDLNARIVGGMKNERAYFTVNAFTDNLEKATLELESG